MPAKYKVTPKRLTPAAARRAVKAVKKTAKKTTKTATKKKLTAKVMKPAVKAKWIAALNSGDYSKGKSSLKNEIGYCCLGVLCDLYAKTKRDGSKFELQKGLFGNTEGDHDFVTSNGDSAGCYLPDTVAKWAGLPLVDDVLADSEEDHQRHLADLNDTTDDFSEVIKYIKKTL